MLDLLFHDDQTLAAAAVTTINHLASLIPARALPAFETQLREATLRAYSWNNHGPREVRGQNWPLFVWALYSMHPNGYVRETAIREFGKNDGLVLPFLLLRVNDWVPQVRELAIERVRQHLKSNDRLSWVPCLGLLDTLRGRSRTDHSWLVAEVTQKFLAEGSRVLLKDALQGADRHVARWAQDAALNLPASERLEFLVLGLKHVDPICRLRAAVAIKNWRDCADRSEMLEMMRADRFMPVRREWLYAILDVPPIERTQWLRSSLLDSHRSMRETARFYLAKQGNFDARTYYLDALKGERPEVLIPAISGLGECGVESDTDLLFAFARHNSSKVAAAAVRAVASLDRDRRIWRFEQLLGDSRACVSKEAMRALIPRGNAVSFDEVRSVASNSIHVHARRNALRILLRRYPLDAVADAIDATANGNPSISKMALAYLEEFLQRYYAYGPSDSQIASIEAAFASSVRVLPSGLESRLRTHLGLPKR